MDVTVEVLMAVITGVILVFVLACVVVYGPERFRNWLRRLADKEEK